MSEQAMYIPAAQVNSQFSPLFMCGFNRTGLSAPRVRSRIDPTMQRALASADPNLPFSGFYGMNDLLAKTLATSA